jgi:hypothetical protein
MGEHQKPTERAEAYFEAVMQVANHLVLAKKLEPRDQAYCFAKTAEGLKELAVGVRATYILLEEVRNLLRAQSAQLSAKR